MQNLYGTSSSLKCFSRWPTRGFVKNIPNFLARLKKWIKRNKEEAAKRMCKPKIGQDGNEK